jgi:hypothetical protein
MLFVTRLFLTYGLIIIILFLCIKIKGPHSGDRSGYPMDEADYGMHVGYETYVDE